MLPEMVVKRYFDTLAELLHDTVVTTREGTPLTLEQGVDITRPRRMRPN
jgi:hypothetical protein